MNSAAANTATTTPAPAPASEFDDRTPEFTDEDFEDLSDLLFIAKCAERRLENIFADEENRALNHLPRFNEGVQALWRLVSIRKALIRLNRESKTPQTPAHVAPEDPDDNALFGVQSSTCQDLSSSSAPSAPSAVNNVFSEPSVSPSSSVLKNSSSHSCHSSNSSPIQNSQFSVSHFSFNSNSNNSNTDNLNSKIPHSSFPIPHSSPVHSVHPVPAAFSVPAVHDIPAAKIADIKKINATLDNLQKALDRRIALCERTGFPVDPLTPAFPLGLTHLPFPPYEPKPKHCQTNRSDAPQPPRTQGPPRRESPSDS